MTNNSILAVLNRVLRHLELTSLELVVIDKTNPDKFEDSDAMTDYLKISHDTATRVMANADKLADAVDLFVSGMGLSITILDDEYDVESLSSEKLREARNCLDK